MIFKIKNYYYQLILISLLGLVTLTWFKAGYIVALGDYFPLYLTPDMIFRDMFLWNDAQLGQASNYPAYSLYSFIWYVLLKAGLSVGFIQIAIFTFYLMGAGLSMYYFARVTFSRKYVPLFASIFYMFNVFVVVALFYHRGISFTYVFLPLLMALLTKIIMDTKEYKDPSKSIILFVIISVPALSFSSFNIPHVVIILLSLIIIALYYLITEKTIRYRLIINLLKSTCLVILLNIWWIIPFINYSTSLSLSADTTDISSRSWTQQRSSFLNLFWLNPIWGWKEIYYPFVENYLNPILLFIVFIPTILAFSSILFKTQERPFLVYISFIVLLSLFLAKGSHEPFSNEFLFENIPGMFLFRNPTLKFTQLALPFLALLIGISCDVIISTVADSKLLKPLFMSSFAIIFIISSFPILTGQVITKGTELLPSSYVKFPEYWYDTATWLNNQDGDFRILLTPGNDFYQMSYTWGYYGADIFAARLIFKPVLQTPFGYAENPEVSIWILEIYDAIENGDIEKFETLLNLTNTKYILHRDDIEYNFSNRKILSSDIIKKFLDNQKDIKLVKTFGKLTIYEYLKPKPFLYKVNQNQSVFYNPFRYVKHESMIFDFENSTDLNNWKLNFGEQHKLVLDEGISSNRKSYLKVELYNSTPGWKVIQSPLIDTIQKNKYEWIISVKGENVSNVHAKMAEYDSDKNLIDKTRVKTIGGYDEPSFNWKNISFMFIPNFNTSHIALEIWHGKETKQSLPNKIWIDDVKIGRYQILYPYPLWQHSTEGIIDPQKISPTLWRAQINTTKPFMLAFSEAYDPLWVVNIDGKEFRSVPVYSVINGFWINQTGDFEITIEYKPQKWFYIGLVISFITLIVCMILYWKGRGL